MIRSFNRLSALNVRSVVSIAARIQTQRAMSTGFLSFLDSANTQKIEYREKVDIDTGKPLHPLEKKQVVDTAVVNNTGLPMREIFRKRHWSIEDFKRPNYPVVVDRVDDQKEFGFRGNKELWALDLPIKMPGKGWALPIEMSQFSEFIRKADAFEQIINPFYESSYAYLCVDQRSVRPGESQRRPGYHADSFVTPYTHGDTKQVLHDSIYVVSDCIPTVFNPGPFPFCSRETERNPQLALEHFEREAREDMDFSHDSLQIVKMDPTVVHKVGINTESRFANRTFAKLVYSTGIFNRSGNDINLLFDYNWPMIERKMENRNTSSVHTEMINGHSHEDYQYLSSATLRKMLNRNREAFAARKNGCVMAYPATPGELLQTVVKGNVTTQNRAVIGDWKITTYLGDQYFIPIESLERYYRHIGTDSLKSSDYNFISCPDIVLALQINNLVRLAAPWGSPQYLMPGDYVVMRKNEVYGVKEESFLSNYSSI
jgi:hypothetical protein